MKQYMMIFIGGDYAEKGLSPEEMQARMGKWFAWDEKMKKQGITISGEALTPEIRQVSGPDRIVTDRTASEIKEVIGGYYVIKAKDMDEVVEVAADFPDYDLDGKVEIREIMVFDEDGGNVW